MKNNEERGGRFFYTAYFWILNQISSDMMLVSLLLGVWIFDIFVIILQKAEDTAFFQPWN